MVNQVYEIRMEISGNTAMWTRPDTGDCPVSYPIPTYSAVKGIFESILWGPAVRVIPTKVEICAPVLYHNYQTNYGGPLRKARVIAQGGGFQLLATVLIDVCYRSTADFWPKCRALFQGMFCSAGDNTGKRMIRNPRGKSQSSFLRGRSRIAALFYSEPCGTMQTK